MTTISDRSVQGAIFGLLKRRGPLSVAQICAELAIADPKEAIAALENLRGERAAQIRHDPGEVPQDEALVVWGLPTFFSRR